MTDEVLVRAEHICKYFKIGGGRMLHAVEDINLDIHRGETLGLVGESARQIHAGPHLMGIYQPTKGKLVYDGRPGRSFQQERPLCVRQKGADRLPGSVCLARSAHDRRFDH